jgi:hypothetical protein
MVSLDLELSYKMEYKKIKAEFMGETYEFVVIDNQDGSFKSILVDESNPEYIAFLEALDKE